MKKVKITDLCDIQVGKTPFRANSTYWGEGYPWLSIADMSRGVDIEKTKETITSRAVNECNCKIVPKNTVVFSFKLSIGKVGITKIPLYTNEAIAAFLIKDSNRLKSKFLFYALKSTDYSSNSNKAVMGKTLNKALLEKFEIPMTSVEEQDRIVESLDNLTKIISNRRQSIELLHEYIKSVFFTTFGDTVLNSKNWKTGNGETYSEKITVGVVIKPASYYVKEGIPALRSQNITKDGIKTENLVYFSEKSNETVLAKSQIKENDVLIVRTGQPGTAAIVPKELDRANCIDIIIVRLKKDVITPEYLVSFFNSAGGKDIVLKTARGQIQQHFNIGSLNEASIPLPPIDLQQKYSEIFKAHQVLKGKMLNELEELEDLFKSQMQKAFNCT